MQMYAFELIMEPDLISIPMANMNHHVKNFKDKYETDKKKRILINIDVEVEKDVYIPYLKIIEYETEYKLIIVECVVSLNDIKNGKIEAINTYDLKDNQDLQLKNSMLNPNFKHWKLIQVLTRMHMDFVLNKYGKKLI